MRVFAAALLSLGVAPAALSQGFEYKQLGDTVWVASEWNGAAPKPKLAPQLAFAAKDRFTASAGCNRFMGFYKVTGANIAFDQKSSTKMACQGERGATDKRLLADLKRITRLAMTADGKALVAHAADGAAIMQLKCAKNC